MKQIHPRLARIGWNRRVLTYADFERACERDGITVITKRLIDDLGRYQIVKGRELITLDVGLRGPLRTFVAFHEYGHALYHVPGKHRLLAKTELEADIIGIVALLPRSLLLRMSPGEISEALGYSLAFVAERYKIWESMRI